jgi:hypothetical protein
VSLKEYDLLEEQKDRHIWNVRIRQEPDHGESWLGNMKLILGEMESFYSGRIA